MKYDFTTIFDHRVDANATSIIPMEGAEITDGFSRIPMWVADMNFATVPTVTEAIAKRIQHPTYGYYTMTDEYYNAIIHWHEARNGVTGLTKECIHYENGALGAVNSAMSVLAAKGDKVLVHAPTYVGFTACLQDAGYQIVSSYLKMDEQGVWRMDFEDMEQKLRDEKIHVAVFCSPHNPCARVWERWELEKAMELFKKYDCYVICDELWSDLILRGQKHIPMQSISEDAKMRTIALYATSKTFNLAGLVAGHSIIYNPYIRDRYNRCAASTRYDNCCVLSMHATIGAYCKEGEEWVDELCQVLSDNAEYAYEYITGHFAGVRVARSQGTYMMFLDCRDWCLAHGKTMDELLRAGIAVGVIWQDGRPFHNEYGIRLNLAVPTALVKEAMDRLDTYVFNA